MVDGLDGPLSCHYIMLVIPRADKQPVLHEIPEVEPGEQQPGGEQQEAKEVADHPLARTGALAPSNCFYIVTLSTPSGLAR